MPNVDWDGEKPRPSNFSARCRAVHAREALNESMAYALDSGRGSLPLRPLKNDL
jgi:hypothetical protein